MTRFMATIGLISIMLVSANAAEAPIFSGPQIGEELAPFAAVGVFDDLAGKKVDIVGDAQDGPLLLIFVHQVTRPSIGLTRTIVNYAAKQKAKGLTSGLVFLSEDPTKTEAWMRRAKRALPANVPPLISPDGMEGPGAYGLNRKMTMTVLVGNKGKVTANFPLIQPSLAVDAPKIGLAIVKVLGGDKQPTLEEMGVAARRPGMQSRMNGIYRRMMAPVIQKTATPDEVKKAAEAVEKLAAKNAEFKARVAKAANLIVNSGRIKNYGTAEAQAYLKKWAKEFAAKVKENQDAEDKEDSATVDAREDKPKSLKQQAP